MTNCEMALHAIHPTLNRIFEETHEFLMRQSTKLLRFARYDVRVEGWLQSEILNLILDLEESGEPISLESVNKGTVGETRRPDFSLILGGSHHYLELKVLVDKRGLRQIINRDMPKLRDWKSNGSLIVLTYGPNAEVSSPQNTDTLSEAGLICLEAKTVKFSQIGNLSLWRY